MTDSNIRVIEIEGVRLEVDMRTAKRIDSFKVGDRVKVLVKQYDRYQSHPASIVAIDAFKNLPTVVIAYIDDVFNNKGEVRFAYLNAQSKDIEICPMAEDDVVPTRQTILAYFNEAQKRKQQELDEITARKEWFLRQYGVAFGTSAADMAQGTTAP